MLVSTLVIFLTLVTLFVTPYFITADITSPISVTTRVISGFITHVINAVVITTIISLEFITPVITKSVLWIALFCVPTIVHATFCFANIGAANIGMATIGKTKFAAQKFLSTINGWQARAGAYK